MKDALPQKGTIIKITRGVIRPYHFIRKKKKGNKNNSSFLVGMLVGAMLTVFLIIIGLFILRA